MLTTHLKTECGYSNLFRWYDENRDYGENGMFSKKLVELLAYIKKMLYLCTDLDECLKIPWKK